MSNEQKSPNVLVIELTDQRPSNFFLDGGGEESGLPTNISAPNARKIKNRSRVAYVETTGPDKGITKLRAIRYIKGCDLIYVDEQEKAGYKPNPANDTIWIVNGKATVIESGADIGLYRFYKNHEGNVSNPSRPEGAVDIFKEIDTELEAIGIEEIFDYETRAMKYLDSLKHKGISGAYKYNEDVLEFLCSLFKLGKFESYRSEAWVAVAVFARSEPRKFLSSIASFVSVIEEEVNRALAKGIIVIDEVQAFFGGTNKKIMNFPVNDTNDEKRQRLVEFFANPSNQQDYQNLRSALHQDKVEKSAIV